MGHGLSIELIYRLL